MANFCKQVNFIDPAVREQLKKIKKDKYIGKDTNFNQLICSLVRKYLSMYRDDEVKYDILLGAFQYVFIKNLKQNFKKFNGKYEGNDIAIEGYINTLMRNAIINESKAALKHLKNRTHVNPIEDESYDQAFDRIINSPRAGSVGRCDYEIIDNLKDQMKELRVLHGKIMNDEVKTKNWSRSVKKIEAKLKDLTHQLHKERGELKGCALEGVEANVNTFDADDEVQYDKLIEEIKIRLGNNDYAEDTATIFSMLLAGINLKEISEALDISAPVVTRRLKYLREIIRDFADELEFFDDDSSLLKELQEFEKGTMKIKSSRSTMQGATLFRQLARLDLNIRK